MVRCIVCPKFTRKTRYCNFYNKTIALDQIHKQIVCDGYPNTAKRKWLLNLANKEENPQLRSSLFYQVLGDKKE